MKEALFSRPRKKPTNNNTNNTNTHTHSTTTPSRKLKLVCSFNGAFNRRPPSNKLRYVGGETRIVSVDRNIGFLKLRLKISDLCPNLGCFSLRYELPTDTDTPLVLIDSDEDVRCMIEEYDKLVLYGKHARLWLFVCNDHDNVKTNDNINGVVKRNSDLHVNSVDTDTFCAKNGVGYDSICGVESQNCETHLSGGQFDANVAKNLVNAVAGVKYGDDSLRKMVLKQQLLAKQSARVNGSRFVSGLGVNETEIEHSCCDHPLIDLGPEPKVSMSQFDPYRVNMIDCKLGNAQLIGSENYGGLVQNTGPRLHPLNPRDGNLRVDTNGSRQCLVGWSGQVLGNGAGISSGNLSHSVALTQALKQSCDSSMVSMFNGADAKQDIRHIQQVSRTSLNRENIMPWAVSCDLVKTPLAPLSCGNQWVGSTYPVKSPNPGYRVWSGYQNGIRNRKFGVNDGRNQWIYPYYIRNHRNNLVEVGIYRAARLDGRLSVGKCYPGLRPNSNISKQGQSVRLYHPNSWKPWPGFPEHSLVQRVSMIDSGFKRGNSSIDVQYSNENIREHHGPAVSQYKSSNPKECHFSYQGACAGLANQTLLSCNTIESPPSHIRAMEAQKDLLTGSHSEMLEAPYQTLSENFHGVPINCEPILCDPKKDKFLVEPQKVFNNSVFSNNTGYSNGTVLGYNTKLLDTEAGNNSLKNHNLQNGMAPSVDLLYNLSLSSSKEVEPLTHSSLASSDVSDAMLKPQSRPIDLMYKGQFSTGPQVDESHGVAYDSCSQIAAKVGKDHVHEEEIQQDPSSGLSMNEKDNIEESRKDSKVIGVISGDLGAIYTHLATRELQTIKNSDLEYIKELGSGTYGTVFYGKWKGSDVAIKRLKPSCFNESSLDEDRLVSDFWREAHMLGQLHHPNIVAFYGVVTDGAVIDLATVTEYMVNGSLKQVLQRKDRTIDRRKRLVIAMDAAFGMEYLHEKSIVHFDLKSRNFLVNMRDPQRPVCKIGDLGLSKIKQRTLVSGGVRGTIPWMAPELLNSKNNMVTEKVDVYSFGIVMWELLTGNEPYANLRSEEIIAGIIKGTLRPEIPTWCDPAWRSLIERCWSSDPDSRPAFSEIAKELRAMSAAMNIK